MPVPMMDIRKMRVLVGQGFMPMEMAVRLAAVPVGIVFVRVVRVVNV